MLFSAPVIPRGTLQVPFILFCFSLLTLRQRGWFPWSLKNDEFTTNNPQVGVN